jgi:hypothetical protein
MKSQTARKGFLTRKKLKKYQKLQPTVKMYQYQYSDGEEDDE